MHPIEGFYYIMNGTCNVVSCNHVGLNPTRVKELGLVPNIEFVFGNATYTRDPLSIMTHDDNDLNNECNETIKNSGRWSDLVNSIISIMVTTEAMNIIQDNVHQYSFPDHITQSFNNELAELFQQWEIMERYTNKY